MSLDPSLPLQKAIIAALRDDETLTEIVANRIYDKVPAAAPYPYVSLGAFQVIADSADCYRGSEIAIVIDGWSRDDGSVEAKQIGGAIREALDDAELTLDDHRLVSIVFDDMRDLRDPDGQTTHVVVTLTALTEPA
jgi:hypothetical protein